MAKIKLELDFEIDFYLIGISCHLPNYRLAWILNQQFNIDLMRQDDLDLTFKKKEKGFFSFYRFDDVENFFTLNIISNRSEKGFFVQEYKQWDYFIQLWLPENETAENFHFKLKKNEHILASMLIDTNELKSKYNFLF